MATRLKTIEYAWETDPTSVMTKEVLYTSPQIIVSIPETGSRTFTSCWMETVVRDKSTLTSGRGDFLRKTSFVAIDNITSSKFAITASNGGFADTGDHQWVILTENLTSFFTSNFTGSAHTMSYNFRQSGSGADFNATNIATKLYCTYTYDDAVNNVRAKTIRLPMELTGSLPTVHLMIPDATHPQIPALDTYLPESNKSIKQVFIQFDGNECNGGTAVDSTVSASLDNEAKELIGTFENAASSAIPMRLIYDVSSMNTSTTHSLRLSAEGSNTFALITPTLVVTYTYDHAASTRILNEAILPFTHPTFAVPAVNKQSYDFPFYIPEPGIIELKQSGLNWYICTTVTGAQISMSIGTGSGIMSRTLAPSILTNGRIITRFDSGGIGYPLTCSVPLTSGFNIIKSSYSATNPQRVPAPTAWYILNYESDKHSNGDGVHNHPVMRLQMTGSRETGLTYVRSLIEDNQVDNTLPEDDYYINAFGYWIKAVQNYDAVRTSRKYIAPLATVNDYFNSQSYGPSTIQLSEDGVSTSAAAAESGMTDVIQPDQSGLMARYPGQPTSSANPWYATFNPETTRSYMLVDPWYTAFSDLITYHSIITNVTGSISGYTGGGSGITVGLHRADTGELVKYGTTIAGGQYTMSWYDRSIPMYVEAVQDTTHAGRSYNSTI
jgi:hypothetical protein